MIRVITTPFGDIKTGTITELYTEKYETITNIAYSEEDVVRYLADEVKQFFRSGNRSNIIQYNRKEMYTRNNDNHIPIDVRNQVMQSILSKYEHTLTSMDAKVINSIYYKIINAIMGG